MTKVTLAMTVCGILVMAGCASRDEGPIVIRNGPQTQNPIADAPGGKLPRGDGAVTNVIIDDSAARPIVTTASAPASTSIFEFTR